tara:strand:+ start:677 stop:1510 length:834 start_codon:yes stop_codon:yes gene_type:complete
MRCISEKEAGTFWRRQTGADIVGVFINMKTLFSQFLFFAGFPLLFLLSSPAHSGNVIDLKEVHKRQQFQNFVGTYSTSSSAIFKIRELSILMIEDEMLQLWAVDSEGNPHVQLLIPMELINRTRKTKFEKSGSWVKEKRKVEFEGKTLFYTIEWTSKNRKTIEFFGLTSLGQELVIHHTRSSFRRDNSFWGEWEEDKVDFLRGLEPLKETFYLWKHSHKPLSVEDLFLMAQASEDHSEWRFSDFPFHAGRSETKVGPAQILSLEDYRKRLRCEDELK